MSNDLKLEADGGFAAPLGSPTPGQRLRRAGWQKRKYGWKSPYTFTVLPQDEAIRVEDFMAGGPVSENNRICDTGNKE